MKNLTNKRINSPEGVSALMESIWLRHKLRMPQRNDNIFIVDLPGTSEETTDLQSALYPSVDFDKDGADLENWYHEKK